MGGLELLLKPEAVEQLVDHAVSLPPQMESILADIVLPEVQCIEIRSYSIERVSTPTILLFLALLAAMTVYKG